MRTWVFVYVYVGLVIGTVTYKLIFKSIDWEMVAERSFFQLTPMVCLWLALRYT